MTQDLLETINGGIATLTMNRPEARNALNREMMLALAEALPRLAADPTRPCGWWCSPAPARLSARAAT